MVVYWGELGLGKTTLMLKTLIWSVLRFDYEALYRGWKWGMPDKTGCKHKDFCEHWEKAFSLVDFTFWEIKDRLKDAVKRNIRLLFVGWDDLGVYFHKSNIQYMHPDVKDFFSKYNFIRPYLANLLITVPNIDFVPEQLLAFCTSDVYMLERGLGDFDRSKVVRNYWGNKRSYSKQYDGREVRWKPIDYRIYREYEKIRHAHALEAFEHPEEIFVTAMPKKEEFKPKDSLLS